MHPITSSQVNDWQLTEFLTVVAGLVFVESLFDLKDGFKRRLLEEVKALGKEI